MAAVDVVASGWRPKMDDPQLIWSTIGACLTIVGLIGIVATVFKAVFDAADKDV
jgi:hypothetical protein